jgi:hypothetical protein
MSTLELEVLRREALEEEKEEIERIRKKYKQRQEEGQLTKTNQTNPEIQALIEEAEQQEQQEKEQIRQKYKQRQEEGQLTKTNQTNPEIQALIEEAEQQEQQEKEQIRQKLKERRKERQLQKTIEYITTQNSEDHDKDVIIEELKEVEEIRERFEENKFDQDMDNDNYPLNNQFDDGINENSYENEDLKINGENEELELVDRSALLAKYNIKDVQEDDVNRILENFDSPIIDENIEIIENKIVSNIKKSALSHPKIEWVNVLVFLDENELEGNIKIFAEYDNGGLLKRIISEDNKKLEVELIQIALYEVWDIFTTLGVNIDDLESKIDVEIELDRA